MSYTDITHFTHDHTLSPVSEETPFKCSGCTEPGWGLRFRCSEGCNFILHKDCAIGPDILNHPFQNTCSLTRYTRESARNCCSACGKHAVGLVYTGGGYTLHPVCAALQPVLQHKEVTLHLKECVHLTKCYRCGKRNLSGEKLGWSYRSTCKKYHLHVSCVMDMLKDYVIGKWERGLCMSTDISSVPDLLPNRGSCSSSRTSRGKNIAWEILAIVLNVVFCSLLGNPLGAIFPFFLS